MIDLIFKYAAGRNFMCYGTPGIEIFFNKLGKIVHIRGDNMDVVDEKERIASNGVGKSSAIDLIVYTLFGQTIKHELTHDQVINNKNKKNLYTEVQWGNYRVVRTRHPNSLKMWESKDGVWDDTTEITKGGMPATQELIKDKLGMNYETFVNIIVFSDSNKDCFLECDGPTKRRVVENLLSLGNYREYFENAKKIKNEYKDKIKFIGQNYEQLLSQEENLKKRIEQIEQSEIFWKKQKKGDLSVIISQIKSLRENLNKTTAGTALDAYNQAQDQIKILTESINNKEQENIKTKEELASKQIALEAEKGNKSSVDIEIQSISMQINKLQSDINNNKNKINSFESKKDTICGNCLGPVKEENYGHVVKSCQESNAGFEKELEKNKKWLQNKKELADQYNRGIADLNQAIKTLNTSHVSNNNEITNNRNNINKLLKVPRPETGAAEKLVEQQIESLKQQAIVKKTELDGDSPYKTIYETAVAEKAQKTTECEIKKAELKKAEEELPYYDFWVKAFGDTGIRKYVIDGIMPALNSRIAYWLQYLIDGKIKLIFNNELEETIERNPVDGDPYVYYAMSGGERRRLNLAVSQAFAYVMMLNSGVSPSLVFLDEVSSNIDPIGVQGVYNMIQELSKDKQVFVTTHDRDLIDMLSGCETINLLKKNGFTTIV